MSEPDYLARNRAVWTQENEQYTDAAAERAWSQEEITWGIFSHSVQELNTLEDVAGLHMTPLALICSPDVGDQTTELPRPHFGLHRIEWTPEDGVEFQLPHGDWVEVLRMAGFDIERLIELRTSKGATRHDYYSDWDPEWSQKWPAEEIWVARKRV